LPAIGATLILGASPASAAQRYASPTGSGVTCSQPSPCGLETAIEGAINGDEVIVAAGDYGSAMTPIANDIVATAILSVHGPASGPLPRLFSSAPDRGLGLLGAGSTLSDLQIEHDSAIYGAEALTLNGSGTVGERLVIHHTGPYGACYVTGATLRDSVCRVTGTGGAVLTGGSAGGPLSATETLRNVTAVSSGGLGISVFGGENYADTVNATNAIFEGTTDVATAESGAPPGTATVNLDHSNYDSVDTSLGGTVTAPGSGTNQTAAPLLVNPAGGDLHQVAGSPTIDAGITSALNGAQDFERQARVQGPGTDIGADEFTPDEFTIPKCLGRTATLYGSEGGDLLRGTAGRDVIAALGGTDIVRGRGGNDLLCGGGGRDSLIGGAGRDRLIGGAGRDTCRGGAGRDVARTCERRRSI
jgi:Ca2+-binding RTX toxin-like protein